MVIFFFYADSESSTIPQVQLNIDFSLWVQKLLLQPEQFRRRARPLSSLEPGVDKYSQLSLTSVQLTQMSNTLDLHVTPYLS